MTEPPDQHLGITELAAICASMRARNIDLFERLGGWVIDTPDPDLQRLFAEASHLHAWHAELWAQRAPVIPPAELDNSVAPPSAPSVGASERATEYGETLDQWLADLGATRARIDVLLDPSTARTIKLVATDLADLRNRITRGSAT